MPLPHDTSQPRQVRQIRRPSRPSSRFSSQAAAPAPAPPFGSFGSGTQPVNTTDNASSAASVAQLSGQSASPSASTPRPRPAEQHQPASVFGFQPSGTPTKTSLNDGSANKSQRSTGSSPSEKNPAPDHYFAGFLLPEAPFTPAFGGPPSSTHASTDRGSTVSPVFSLRDSASKPSPPPFVSGATISGQSISSPGSSMPLKPSSQPKLPAFNDPSQLNVEFSRLQVGRNSPSPNQTGQAQALTVAAPDSQDTEAAHPYDVASEDGPAHPFYQTSFQKSLQFGRELASDTADTIQRVPHRFRDQVLNSLLSDAETLSAFQPSTAKTVAILGDSGEGKSSLINSLLHISGLAQTSDAGSACTSVVTEYRYKERHHTAPITIEVEYLSREGIEEMITELLWSYRSLYYPELESSQTSSEEYERVQRESSEAWSALKAAFGHQSELTEHRFRDQSSGSSDRLRTQLIAWARDIQWPSGNADGRYTDVAQTAQDCCRSTAIFMSDRYWPFTKVIRIFVDAEVLKAGVILVDLPGLEDTNLARIRITQDYLMKCDNIFLVAKISRAITDQSLKSSLYSVLSRHMHSESNDTEGQRRKDFSISVICTKTEDIDIKAARERFCGEGKAVSKSDSDNLDEGIRNAKASGNSNLKKQLKHRREALFIEARNSHVQAGLQKAYASKLPGGKLEVFCVSNRLYDKQCKRGDAELVAVSGIPKLRAFCRLLVADGQLTQAQNFLKSSLFSLVNSFELWTTKMSAASPGHDISEESKSRILKAYQNLAQKATTGATKLKVDFDVCFQDQILDFCEYRHDFLEQAALKEAKKWEAWHPSQYNAWCRRNGWHSKPKRDQQDWNADIIWKMRSELEFQWEVVEDDVPDVCGALLRTIDASVQSFAATVRVSVPGKTYSMLKDGMDSTIRHFRHKLDLLQNRLLSEVKLTRRYASQTNQMSYILGQMKTAYRSAATQHGDGRWGRQKAIIGGRVGDGLLFPNIYVAMGRRHQALVEFARSQVQDLVRDLTDKIKRDVNSALASIRQPDNVEEMAAVRELLVELRAAALRLGE